MKVVVVLPDAQSGSSGMPNLAELQEAVIGCNAADPDTQFKATQYVRRLLSIEKNPPIQYVKPVLHPLGFSRFWCRSSTLGLYHVW